MAEFVLVHKETCENNEGYMIVDNMVKVYATKNQAKAEQAIADRVAERRHYTAEQYAYAEKSESLWLLNLDTDEETEVVRIFVFEEKARAKQMAEEKE